MLCSPCYSHWMPVRSHFLCILCKRTEISPDANEKTQRQQNWKPKLVRQMLFHSISGKRQRIILIVAQNTTNYCLVDTRIIWLMILFICDAIVWVVRTDAVFEMWHSSELHSRETQCKHDVASFVISFPAALVQPSFFYFRLCIQYHFTWDCLRLQNSSQVDQVYFAQLRIMCQVTRSNYTSNTVLCKKLIVVIVQCKLFGNAKNLISCIGFVILFWIVSRYEMSWIIQMR